MSNRIELKEVRYRKRMIECFVWLCPKCGKEHVILDTAKFKDRKYILVTCENSNCFSYYEMKLD